MDQQMEQPRHAKFYQTQTFRALVAIVLASALLATGAMEGADSLFGAPQEGVLGVEDEIAPEPMPDLAPTLAEPTEAGGDGLPGTDPSINLTVSVEGDKATIRADIGDTPKGIAYILQWQNDQSGTFEDVPGETGDSITFDANAANMNCNWRVELTPIEEVYYR